MKKRTAIATVTAAAALVLALAGCGSSSDDASTDAGDVAPNPAASKLNLPLPDRIAQSKTVNVANPLANPPYAFKDVDGKLQGIAPDLAKALEPMLGVTFKFVDTPFPGLMPGLQAGRFDMIWGSVTDTKEREATLDFVDYEKDGGILLVVKGNPEKIADVTSLCGKSVSGLAGSHQLEILTEQSSKCTAAGDPAMDIKTFTDVPSGELALRSGQVECFMAGLGAGLWQVRTADGGNAYESVGPIYQEARLGAGFQKSDPELRDAIQAGIKALVADGTYAKILDKYGMSQAALTEDEITINGAKG